MKEILVMKGGLDFIGYIVGFLDLGGACIKVWQATGLAVCCMAMLYPSANTEWKTSAERPLHSEAVCVRVCSVAQLYPTLCNTMGCSVS